MAKRLAKPAASVGYRLDWDTSKVREMDAAAAHVGLSVASFARLALELLIERKSVTLEEVRKEADRLTGHASPVPLAPAPPVDPPVRPMGKRK